MPYPRRLVCPQPSLYIMQQEIQYTGDMQLMIQPVQQKRVNVSPFATCSISISHNEKYPSFTIITMQQAIHGTGGSYMHWAVWNVVNPIRVSKAIA